MIGLGLMGTAMTERLLEHGWNVHVWNRTRDKADPLLEKGAVWSENPLVCCDRVIMSLYTSDVVEEVLGQMQGAMRRGQTLIDTTTGEPEQSCVLAAWLLSKGVTYLDAPISGSSEQTRRGEATVMASGDRATFDANADLWPVLGHNIFYIGTSGAAARMKLISNLVLGLNRAVLAEGLVFAEALGVDPAAALEVMKGSMAYSKAMDVKGRKMIEGDYSVQARLSQHLKDVRLMLQSASAVGLSLPLSETHREMLEKAEAQGFGDLDNCSIIETFRRS